MVSFSCDKCQNVFTKPKVVRHLLSCKTQSVSCIDCGVVFDKKTVREHKSCISEAEKYAPKNTSSTECTQTFCGICKLALNGAVHALQHYDSKKHRAAERKLKEAEKRTKQENKAPTTEPQSNPQTTGTPPASASEPGVPSALQNVAAKGKDLKQDKTTKENIQDKHLGIKKAIKKALKKAPKQKLKRDGLIRAVTVLLGKKSPSNLPELVDKRVNNSSRFKLRRGRISLVLSGES